MHDFFLPNPLVFATNFMFQRGSPSAPKNSLEFSPCPTRRLRPCSVATGFSHAVRLTNLKYVATSPFWLAGWVTRRSAGPGWPSGWLAVGGLALAGPASGLGTATDWPGGQVASYQVADRLVSSGPTGTPHTRFFEGCICAQACQMGTFEVLQKVAFFISTL